MRPPPIWPRPAVEPAQIAAQMEIAKIATISSPFKRCVRMSKLYCVVCPFPGGGKSSESRLVRQRRIRAVVGAKVLQTKAVNS